MVSALVEMDFVHTSRNVPRLQPGFFKGMNPGQPKGEREFPFAWLWWRWVSAKNLRRFPTAATVQYR